MIDSNYSGTLLDVIQKFREYIEQNFGNDSKNAKAYFRISDRIEHYAIGKDPSIPPDLILLEYHDKIIGEPATGTPLSRTKKKYLRTINILLDLLRGVEPRRRYNNHPHPCPELYQDILSRYQTLMEENQKSQGTIRTRVGRMIIFFSFLADKNCVSLRDIEPELFAEYISSLNGKYSSQGKASLLYTIRNFFSYEEFSNHLSFDPLPFLTRIHSKKHERLPSFYTPDEVRKVLSAVDRTTSWGKTIYLMMLLACVYGLRSSDIKALRIDNINWKSKTITLTQFKTHREISLPITDEVLFALLDYIKNVRPKSNYANVFIRLKKPHLPYSMADHFGDKLRPYFDAAGVDVKGKHHGLHSLRHSLATNLLESGTPVNEIAVILGHTSASATKAYVWSDIEHIRIAALEVPE